MVVLKIMGKIVLVPVWIVVAIIWLMVKMTVTVYSFIRGFIVLGLGIMIAGTVICYQDWRQALLLLCISGVTFILLFAGISIETCLETIRSGIGYVIKN